MKKSRWLVVALVISAAWFGTPPACFAATFTATDVADSFVAAGTSSTNLSNNNYGGGGALALAAPNLPNGEFQSVIKFDLSGAATAFNTQFGVGQWSIQSVVLQLTSSPHNNAIYNNIAAGQFGISLMQNNSWVEGTGNASNPTQNGITFSTLQSTYINNASDQSLGAFTFPGGSSGLNNYTLTLSSSLLADIAAGGQTTLRFFADDNAVSYLFNSRGQAGGQPDLLINAVPEPHVSTLLGLAFGTLLIWRSRAWTIVFKQATQVAKAKPAKTTVFRALR